MSVIIFVNVLKDICFGWNCPKIAVLSIHWNHVQDVKFKSIYKKNKENTLHLERDKEINNINRTSLNHQMT